MTRPPSGRIADGADSSSAPSGASGYETIPGSAGRQDIWQPSQIELERRAFRKKQSTRSVWIGIASTLVFAAIVWFTVINTKGWAVTQESFFNPEIAWKSLGDVLSGLWLNIQVLFFASIGVAILATVIAAVRTLRGPIFFPLRMVATGYTDLFRGLPLFIVLYLVGFGIPGLRIFPILSPMVWGTVALIITYSAYVAEVLRAGMEAVHPSQRLAARSLGLTHWQTLRTVVFPQAIRKVTPALLNDFVSMQKDVGLISVLGAVDAVRAAQNDVSLYANFTPYVVAGLLFVLLSLPLIRFIDFQAARAQRRQQIGGTV